MYKFTDNAMESGVAVCDTDITNDNFMHLKYSDKSDFICEAPNGVLSYEELTITAQKGIKVALSNGKDSNKALASKVIELADPVNFEVTGEFLNACVFIDENKNLIIKKREETHDEAVTTASASDVYLYNSKKNYYYDENGQAVIIGELGKITSVVGNIISLNSKEVFRATDYREFATALENATNELKAAGDELITTRTILNRLYDGVDLTVKFANEIANFSDPWAWIKDRITKGNFSGLYVGDYIPMTLNAGTVAGYSISKQDFKCQIAGINTYKNCQDQEVGNHIDFISKEVINTPIKWNPSDTNNGTSAENHPWLASALYAILNGVNNYSTAAYGNLAHGANANNAGIYQLLPQALRSQIIKKRDLLDKRYDSKSALTYSTSWDWLDVGYLWVPKETEVYGQQVRSNLGYAQGYWNPENGLSAPYPLFMGQARNRVKRNSSNARCYWWLLSPASSHSTNVCNVNAHGYCRQHLSDLCDDWRAGLLPYWLILISFIRLLYVGGYFNTQKGLYEQCIFKNEG